MPLTPGTVGRDNEATGQDFLIFLDGSSRRIQSFAIVDDTGAHAGITGTPLVTSVSNTVTVSGTVAISGSVATTSAAETFVRYSSAAAEDSTPDVGTGACELRQLRAILDSTITSTRYLMFFNSTTLPANGTAPVWRVLVPAGGESSESFEKGEMAFTTGLTVALSSTIGTLTVTTASEGYLQIVVAT